MKRVEFVKEFKERSGLTSQKDSREILDIVGQMITEHMLDEDGVQPFAGFKFEAKYTPSREYKDPNTREVKVTPAKYRPKVKFGKSVKDNINK